MSSGVMPPVGPLWITRPSFRAMMRSQCSKAWSIWCRETITVVLASRLPKSRILAVDLFPDRYFHLIYIDGEGRRHGAPDPRGEGYAAGY